jgi:lipopolysaccharide transport system ATP-binding protein
MSRPIIEVENLSKRYRLGQFNAQTMREEVEQFFLRLRNKRAGKGDNFPAQSSEFWALKDVSFSVQPGEVIGIIGRNGAGKSTLLKILSRVTEPTVGNAYIRGRIASLLEVGTGFHPELTGRENIYLNGAILGMTQLEIRRKFDEIVDFSGVEKFLDTPVKRYSSGMYVRLAFAVAAHLEPEILVVDEVLAVGDTEFQKKCLGKMNQVAIGGRTVLFVSHNMNAIQALCGKAILLQDGQLISMSATAAVIDLYLSSNVGTCAANGDLARLRRKGAGDLRFRSIAFFDQYGRIMISPKTGEELNIRLDFCGNRPEPRPARIGITFYDIVDSPLFLCASEISCREPPRVGSRDSVECRIPRFPLSAGRYKINLFLEWNGVIEDWLEENLVFDVLDSSYFGTARNLPLGWEGRTVLVNNEWRKIVAEIEA